MRIRPTLILLAVLISLGSMPRTAFAQMQLRDVVYLKNGSVIKGVIIEQTSNISLKIQTYDGSIYFYSFSDIEKIEKETRQQHQQRNSEATPAKGTFSLFAGVAVPMGEFGSENIVSGGFAETGYSFGVDYKWPINNSSFCLINGSIAHNGVNEEALSRSSGVPSDVSIDVGSWLSGFALTGIGFKAPVSRDLDLYGAVEIGALGVRSPNIKLSYLGTAYTLPSDDAGGFAYGFSGGVQTKKFNLRIMLLSGETPYDGIVKQETSLIQIMVGTGF